MSGKIARRLRKIAEKEFKRLKQKPGMYKTNIIEPSVFYPKGRFTLFNAFKNFYKKHKTLYNQGKLKIINYA